MEKNWCQHNVWINDNIYVLQLEGGCNRAVCKDEMFCAICGAPRPAVRKSLGEKLRIRKRKHWKTSECDADSLCLMNNLANEALDHFLEVLNNYRNIKPPLAWACLEDIERAMRESVQ